MRCEKWKDRDFLNKARETCERSPTTYDEIEKVIDFYDVYPEISDLSVWAVRPLIYEKDVRIQKAAIEVVKTEMGRRTDISSPNFSISRTTLTGDQVRKIVNEQYILIEGTDIEREKLSKEKDNEDRDVLYTCPLCQGMITIQLSKRDKIVSLRATEDADDAYSYLAKRFGISRSFLLSELIALESKFPNLFS
jgi:hypothetical protein